MEEAVKKSPHSIWYYAIAFTMVLVTITIIVEPILNNTSMTKYSVHIMLLMLAGSLLMMRWRKKELLFLGLFCTSLIALFLKTSSNAQLLPPKQNQEPKIKVAHFNLSNIEGDLGYLMKMLDQDSIDVLSFQEYTPYWRDLLETTVALAYPHHKSIVRIDPFGTALFSKEPFAEIDTFMINEIPSMEMTLDKNGKSFHIVSSYITPSLDSKSSVQAESQLNYIAEKINTIQQPVIALGEFNMVYWSHEIRNFISQAELNNSRRDIIESNLRIPYDHIFFSKSLQCIDFRELNDDKSKHIGIVGTYQHLTDQQKHQMGISEG